MAEKVPAHDGRMLRGVVLTLLGGTFWGVNGTVSGILMSRYGVDPLWLACVRELSACWLFLLAARMSAPERLQGLLQDRRSLVAVFAVALGSILFSQVSYLEAIHWTNSATATVLQNLSVLLVMLYVCVVNGRPPRRREAAGVVLAFVGTYLIATGGNPGALSLPFEGLVWGMGCALAATFLAIQPARLIARWGNFAVNGLAFLMSGLVLLVVVQPWAHLPQLDLAGWGMVLFSIVFGTFGAYGLYLQGVKEVGAVRGIMLGTAEPVMATITSVLLMGISFAPTDLVGFAMITVMVFLTA